MARVLQGDRVKRHQTYGFSRNDLSRPASVFGEALHVSRRAHVLTCRYYALETRHLGNRCVYDGLAARRSVATEVLAGVVVSATIRCVPLYAETGLHGDVVESFGVDRLEIDEATSRFQPVGVKDVPELEPKS